MRRVLLEIATIVCFVVCYFCVKFYLMVDHYRISGTECFVVSQYREMITLSVREGSGWRDLFLAPKLVLAPILAASMVLPIWRLHFAIEKARMAKRFRRLELPGGFPVISPSPSGEQGIMGTDEQSTVETRASDLLPAPPATRQ